jgi:hypothetical protein
MMLPPPCCHFFALGIVLLVSDCFAEDAKIRTIHAQPSYVISTKQVELAVTELGGHMAPVTFFRDSDKPVQPYYVSPWQDETPLAMPAPVLVPLRGDFFCLPFGGNAYDDAGEKHPPHGDIVGRKWTYVGTKKSGDVTTLTMSIDTQVRRGRVTKELSLIDAENVIYSRHTIDGFAGRAPLGHHATLAMPDKEGSVRLTPSPFRFGMTCPGQFSDPKQGEYQSLLPGVRWATLTKVPVAWKGEPDADLTRLPARQGYADLIQLVNEPWDKTNGPAWMTATFGEAGYLWFSLKDPAVLNSTVVWIENRGRHRHPWSGRNNCLGLEDVTSHFADGLATSNHENILSKEGINTALELKASESMYVNYIQGAVKIPTGFETVKTLEFAPGQVTFLSTTGKRVTVPVRHEFLKTGML